MNFDDFSDDELIEEIRARDLEDEFEDYFDCRLREKGMESFSDEELEEELWSRGRGNSLLYKIYQLRRNGKPYEAELEHLIQDMLGVIV